MRAREIVITGYLMNCLSVRSSISSLTEPMVDQKTIMFHTDKVQTWH